MITPRLTDIQTLKYLLNKHGVQANKAASQNFLIAEEVVEATVMALDPAVTAVTELGAGLGTLTQGLVGAGFTVRALERDKVLGQILPTVLPAKQRQRVTVELADLREIAWAQTEPWQLAGNIPYHLSGFILRQLTQLESTPARAVLLMQQEVGERLLASPGEMSLVSLAVQLWGEVHELLRVPPHCFWPPPAVHSMLVLLVPHAQETARSVHDREAILKLAKPFFQAKRKQMAGTLRRQWHLSPEDAVTLLAAAKIGPAQRPQELSRETWVALAAAARAAGIS